MCFDPLGTSYTSSSVCRWTSDRWQCGGRRRCCIGVGGVDVCESICVRVCVCVRECLC